MPHSMIVPDEALENLRNAVSIFRKETRSNMIQAKFIEILFSTDPEIIANVAIKNYKKYMENVKTMPIEGEMITE